jgi:hypothetical protein
MDYDFPFSWEFHHPNWRTHIFQRGWVETTNQKSPQLLPDFLWQTGCPTGWWPESLRWSESQKQLKETIGDPRLHDPQLVCLSLTRCLVGGDMWWLEPWNGFWFSHHIGNFIIPTDELIFFRWVQSSNQSSSICDSCIVATIPVAIFPTAHSD